MPELLHTAVYGLPPARIGKVREVYDLGHELLIVATDRISAFDVVMANGVPDKGSILTQMSGFWFNYFGASVPNHVVSLDNDDVQARCKRPQPELAGRTMIAKKAEPLPVECVARGYITGSLYKEYQQNGGKELHGFQFPDGLLDASQLPEPIFTPATKAETGHDENISFQAVVDLVGKETAQYVMETTLRVYAQAATHCFDRGIILADTKFEFGRTDDGIIWIDEALTPDSSRFWDATAYAPGRSPESFDKQFVRNYLLGTGWDQTPPGPVLPEEIISRTRAKYFEAFHRVTGQEFQI
jgi:phosphoribosylaminoimidazole-succinocarboxamide synthase